MGSSFLKNWGHFCICSVFRQLRDLMANIFWMKRDYYRHRVTALKNKTTLGLSAAQIRSPKRCQVRNAIASGGLKWQYIAIIATFSSWEYLFYVSATVDKRCQFCIRVCPSVSEFVTEWVCESVHFENLVSSTMVFWNIIINNNI